MALQPYADPGQTLALYQAEQITSEEQERRKQEVRKSLDYLNYKAFFQKNAAGIGKPSYLFINHEYNANYLYVMQAEELDKKLRHILEDVPDRVYHVMGSNAGAGSGEFHTYRHSRRREQERLKRIDEEAEKQAKEKERLERLMTLEDADEEKTAKRRAKRQKKKVGRAAFDI